MPEITIASIRSATHPTRVTEQPNRILRWWIRHYRHAGLASMAGSAILACVIAVILLPVAFRNPAKDDEECVNGIHFSTIPMFPIIKPSTLSPASMDNNTLPINTQIIPIDRLCAATATWKSQGITVAGSINGESSLSREHLQGPNDLLLDTNNNLFIADSKNNRIVYWPVNASEGRTIMGTGTTGSWSNLFKYPASIIAWKDRLYVSDLGNYRILTFPLTTTEGSPDGITIIGRHGAGSSLNQINSVYSMSIDKIREIFYLCDYRNHRILKLNLTDNSLQLVAGTGTAALNNMSLNHPLDLTIDETTGSFYVTDSRNHRIQKFNLNSIQGLTVAGGINYGQNLSELYLPSSVAIDPTNNLYIADSGNHRIIQWLVGARQGRVIAGTGIAGVSSIQLNNPVQLKFDKYYNLYVVDQNNNRIQRFDLLSNGC